MMDRTPGSSCKFAKNVRTRLSTVRYREKTGVDAEMLATTMYLEVHGRVGLEAGRVEVTLPRVDLPRREVVIKATRVHRRRDSRLGARRCDGERKVPLFKFV